jgi:uncharacterized NAD-dependent epimerase/dehydratase family protein
VIHPQARLALLMHGHLQARQGKMGLGLLRYSTNSIVAVVDRNHVGGSIAELTGINRTVPIVGSAAAATKMGADTLVLAVATSGGVLPEDFRSEIISGLRSGMSLVNGLHGRYAEIPEFAAALQPGRSIFDVRVEPAGLSPGRGLAATTPARRILTVGTDMAIGKMTASLALHRVAVERGLRSKFLATGQIGMCIAGDGVALDAVRVDFASGAVEQMVVASGSKHDVLWVEGQGSILHPSSTAWLALLRGSMPTDLVLVHRAGQEHVHNIEGFGIPPLVDVISLYEAVARGGGSFPPARVRAIALNCAHLPNDEAARLACTEVERSTGLVCDDVVRFGAERLLDSLQLVRLRGRADRRGLHKTQFGVSPVRRRN